LAAVEAGNGNHERELRLLSESVRYTENPTILTELFKGIAVVKAKEGYYKQALEDLERLIPMLRYAKPHVYFDILNSYAVELGVVGRIEEAKNVCNIVLASPYAFAYPEWHETAKELKEPSRSFITVPSIEYEPVEAHTTETYSVSELEQPTGVLTFRQLKEAPRPHKPDRLTPEENSELTPSQKRELILAAIRSGAVRDSDYDKMMITAGLLKGGPAARVIDLEDESLLNDVIMLWCNMIDAEEFASVMSALRDCKGDLRRANIIDNMITIAFQQTPNCMGSEQEWRLKVERKLPKK
jgi:hypothetical protein